MSTELAKRPQTPQQALERILMQGRGQLEMALGKAMDPNRMIRLAVTALHQSPSLQNCTMVSIANSVMLAAQLHLEINTGLGHAWLIPYRGQCTFQIGYRGLIELAHRNPEVHDINAHLVYEHDVFELEYGDNPRCVHRPALKARGEWIGAYATVRYHQGSPSSLYMFREEIEAIRDKTSQSWKSVEHKDQSPWVRFPDEMIRKTPTKRMAKFIRLSIPDLSRAVGLDDAAEARGDEDPRRKNDPRHLVQEQVLDTELLDAAEVATLELAGSKEAQESQSTAKVEELSREELRRRAVIAGIPEGLSDLENRQLDAEIAASEGRK